MYLLVTTCSQEPNDLNHTPSRVLESTQSGNHECREGIGCHIKHIEVQKMLVDKYLTKCDRALIRPYSKVSSENLQSFAKVWHHSQGSESDCWIWVPLWCCSFQAVSWDF